MINLTQTEAEHILDTLLDISQSTEIDYTPLLDKIVTSIKILDPLLYPEKPNPDWERRFDE